MMNFHLPLVVGSESITFTASVLVQSTLVILVALLLGRFLRYQPALRHSVLLGGLICVCACPLATYLADQFGSPGLSLAWPTFPDSNSTSLENSKLSNQPLLLISDDSSESIDSRETLIPHEPTAVSFPEVAAKPPESPIRDVTADHAETATADSTAPPVIATGIPVKAAVSNDGMIELSDTTKQTVSAGPFNQISFWMQVANTVALIWLIGIVLSSIRLLLAWRYLKRLRLDSRAIDDQTLVRLANISEEVCRAVGVRKLPPLYTSDNLTSPISLGVLRPAIIIPKEIFQGLDDSHLRDILIHETAHIHRHDYLVVILQRVASTFFWPFPLVWWLNAKIDEAREDVCDNYVLGHTEASQYSRMLLELTEQVAKPQTLPLAIGLWKCKRKLEQRVIALLDPRRKTKTRLQRRTLLTLTVAFGLTTLLLTGSRFTQTTRAQIAATQQPASEAEKGDKSKPQSGQTKSTKKNNDVGNETKLADNQQGQDPYDVLYDVIMTRHKNGKAYAQDETSPAIFPWSEFPFDDQTFTKFNAALDAFAALPQERIDQYSDVKRALMQRHLWEVFDTTFNWNWSGDWYWGGRKAFPKTHMARRTALKPKIVSLIRRLALSEKRIRALPNPLSATVTSHEFAQTHDPANRFKPFLPSDLYAEESSWICLGEDQRPIPASTHTGKLYSRSIFLQFMRLPGGRNETLEYIERIKKRVEQFPAGTQFALIEQPFLISNEGKLVLSPMIVSVQLRAYLDVGRSFRASGENKAITQCVAEFVMQPRQLMKGDAMMKAIGPDEFRYDAGAPFAAGFSPRDPFATGEIAGRMPGTTRLNLCMSCHGRAGERGVMTTTFPMTRRFVTETNAEEVRKATLAQKLDSEHWKNLQKHWKDKSSGNIDEATLAELSKPTLELIPKEKPKVKTYKTDEKQLAMLVDRLESEYVGELKKIHSAILLSEIAKLSETFSLSESDGNRLRLAAREAIDNAVEKTRTSLKSALKDKTTRLIRDPDRDIDPTAFKINGRLVSLDSNESSKENVFDRYIYSRINRRGSKLAYGVSFGGLTWGGIVQPQAAGVQQEETWKKTIADVLTKKQLEQYSDQFDRRLKSSFTELILTALQFDLDIPEQKVPMVRKRIEEQVNVDSSRIRFIERTISHDLRNLKANHLADILTKEQLTQRTDLTKSEIKSAIVSMVLEVLRFDLHLKDSQLPVVRERLEKRINPGELQSTIESAALHSRWKLQAKDFADVLTEQQQILWPVTQLK